MRSLLVLFLVIMIIGCKNGEKKEPEVSSIVQKEHPPEVKESISRGAEVYTNFCASCHLSSGEGITGTFPPLKGSNWLTEKRKKTIHATKFGISGPITVNGREYDNLMPALGLTDAEVADVLNYIGYSWGNEVKAPFTEEEVAAIEK